HALLELDVAERAAELVARARQVVERAAARELHGLQRRLGGAAADDDREVVRRAGRGAERADLPLQEGHQRVGLEHGPRLLEQEGLVRRAAALRDDQEAVLVALRRVELDLRRQVGAGV